MTLPAATPATLARVLPVPHTSDQPVSPSQSGLPATPDTTALPTLPTLRIGEGWDCHALVPGRPLMLGGVSVPHTHGLLGHSDADVLLHAVTDALLGGAGLGDIGRHFPDTDPRFKGADSGVLLAEAMARVRQAGFELVNVDCTVVAQAPKLAPHMDSMVQRMATLLNVHTSQVNVKAKTAERLGPVGQGLSMEARAVVLLSGAGVAGRR
ncbi:MAG: 2-C-methyl-D-erythritol 2,4-cyclodiphosphate synthase [Burkholderiales bacterium]|nr:2-C-methyl-D-erythritol 2,4-cyclodiphosphate synthase [Burkholderiales bacterium]